MDQTTTSINFWSTCYEPWANPHAFLCLEMRQGRPWSCMATSLTPLFLYLNSSTTHPSHQASPAPTLHPGRWLFVFGGRRNRPCHPWHMGNASLSPTCFPASGIDTPCPPLSCTTCSTTLPSPMASPSSISLCVPVSTDGMVGFQNHHL
jgi:hypothetical protein